MPMTKEPRTTQAQRIAALMDARGIPERKRRRALSRVTGATYETVRQWFEKDLDNITKDYLVEISRAYNCSMDWLISGEGSMDKGAKIDNGRGVEHNSRRVPVLSYIQAGDPKPAVDSYMAGAGMSDIAVDSEIEQDLSLQAFGLVVSGNSMAPEFRDGDIVVVDPDEKPQPGDVVVAVLDHDRESTIKKYRSRGNDASGHHVFELAPLNEDYHTIIVSSENPGHIVGTVVEHRRNLVKRR